MRQRARADKLTICCRKNQTDVSFSCVCPVIDHELRHNIVKIAVDLRGDNRVDPQTIASWIHSYFDNVMT